MTLTTPTSISTVPTISSITTPSSLSIMLAQSTSHLMHLNSELTRLTTLVKSLKKEYTKKEINPIFLETAQKMLSSTKKEVTFTKRQITSTKKLIKDINDSITNLKQIHIADKILSQHPEFSPLSSIADSSNTELTTASLLVMDTETCSKITVMTFEADENTKISVSKKGHLKVNSSDLRVEFNQNLGIYKLVSLNRYVQFEDNYRIIGVNFLEF